MILILEILLTVKAYKKGWRAWALLPPVVITGIGLLLVGAGGPAANISPFAYLPFDLLIVGILGVMAWKGPQKAREEARQDVAVPAIEHQLPAGPAA